MFSQTPANHAPAGPFIILSKVDSTNNYAMAKLHSGMLEHGTSLLTPEQYAGKGSRGKTWVSNPGENITMSTLFSIKNSLGAGLSAVLQRFPFLLSASVALGCYDFIKGFGVPDISIKWPNDIYIGDRKAAGILIENLYRSHQWLWSIAGTGINMNQLDFSGTINTAVSISSVTGKKYNIPVAARNLQQLLLVRYAMLEKWEPSAIMNEYNSLLYRKGEVVKLRKGNILFSTTIIKVDPDGLLLTSDSISRSFQSGEVEFITG